MRVAHLTRGPSTDQGTFGVLRFGSQVVYSLELPWRSNVRRRSCVPEGAYRCSVVVSPRFGRVYTLHDVPDRSGILIHPANLAGDTLRGWSSQLQGCIAPCQRIGAMRNDRGVMQAAGLASRPAVFELVSWARGEPFTLEISE